MKLISKKFNLKNKNYKQKLPGKNQGVLFYIKVKAYLTPIPIAAPRPISLNRSIFFRYKRKPRTKEINAARLMHWSLSPSGKTDD